MVDLIPEEYRRAVRARRLLLRFGWACLGVVAVVAAGSGALAHLVGQERVALARYKQLQAHGKAQRARLAELMVRRDAAKKQLAALDLLRGDASIGRLVEAVDHALDGRIWFQELTFSRGADGAERKPEAAGAGATAAAAPDKRGDARPEEPLLLSRERTEIRGLARDHGALADFIKRLGDQPGVKQVKLVDTAVRSYPGVQVVGFQLTASFGAAPGPAR